MNRGATKNFQKFKDSTSPANETVTLAQVPPEKQECDKGFAEGTGRIGEMSIDKK